MVLALEFLNSRIGNSIISRNGHNRYQEIDHELIFCEQGIKKGKVTGEEGRKSLKQRLRQRQN